MEKNEHGLVRKFLVGAGLVASLFGGMKEAKASPFVQIVPENTPFVQRTEADSIVQKGQTSYFDVYIGSDGHKIYSIDSYLNYSTENLVINSASILRDKFWNNLNLKNSSVDGVNYNVIMFKNLSDARNAIDAAFRVNFTADNWGVTTLFLGYNELVGLDGGYTKYTNEPDNGQPLDTYGATIYVPYPGDANIDGIVDSQDYTTLKQNMMVERPTTAGMTIGEAWGKGDFNLDGFVDKSDLLLLEQNFGKSRSNDFNPTSGLTDILAGTNLPQNNQSIPEPTSMAIISALALAGMAGMNARRRRNQRN